MRCPRDGTAAVGHVERLPLLLYWQNLLAVVAIRVRILHIFASLLRPQVSCSVGHMSIRLGVMAQLHHVGARQDRVHARNVSWAHI